MKFNHVIASLVVLACVVLGITGCEMGPPTSDQIQSAQQEKILAEGTSAVGMPAVKNFRERKLMKDIIELRDQEGLVTYTYVFNEYKGCLILLGSTVGYPIPYSTQFTNPQKIETWSSQGGYAILPQADPNGLFSPSSAEATWTVMKNPKGNDTGVVYSEPKLITMPFRAAEESVCNNK